LEQEGIEFKTGVHIGKPVFPTVAELTSTYDAVLLTTGSTRPRNSGVPGDHMKGVYNAMDFLTKAQKSLQDSDFEDGDFIDAAGCDVVVLGGGDTAVDCLATATRMGAKSVVQFSRRGKADEMEWSPTPGPRPRPARTPWPAWADVYRVDYAHQETGALSVSTSGAADPREYNIRATTMVEDVKKPGAVKGVRACPVAIEKGRVVDVEGQEKVYPAQLVLVALGFTGPEALMGVPLDRKANFEAAYGSYKVEGFSNLFCAGDCRRGASLVVTAIAEGRDSANRVDDFLNGETTLPRTAPLQMNPSLYVPEKRKKDLKSEVPEQEYARGLVGEASVEIRKSRRFVKAG